MPDLRSTYPSIVSLLVADREYLKQRARSHASWGYSPTNLQMRDFLKVGVSLHLTALSGSAFHEHVEPNIPEFHLYSVHTKQSKFHSNIDAALFWIHTWKRQATCTSCLLHIPTRGWFSQRCPACVSLEQCQWPAYTCGHPSTAGTFCSLSLLAFHRQVSFPLLAAPHSPHTAWYSGRYILLKRY